MDGSLRLGRSVFSGRALTLVGLLCLQVICTLLLLADALADLFGLTELVSGAGHHTLEFAVVVLLLLGIAFTALEIRRVLRRHRSMENTLRAASGAFQQLMEENFDAWSLTPSERDVALLAIKGLSIAEIAKARQTKEGTIKAQCNSTYRKAGVSGRTQLLSHFIDELMDGGLGEPRDANSAAPRAQAAQKPRATSEAR